MKQRCLNINRICCGYDSFRDLTKICLIIYWVQLHHYDDVIMGANASQITSLTIVYLTVYSGTNQRKHQSSASLAFVRGIHRWPVNSPHKGPVTRKMFPFDDAIIWLTIKFVLECTVAYWIDTDWISSVSTWFMAHVWTLMSEAGVAGRDR